MKKTKPSKLQTENLEKVILDFFKYKKKEVSSEKGKERGRRKEAPPVDPFACFQDELARFWSLDRSLQQTVLNALMKMGVSRTALAAHLGVHHSKILRLVQNIAEAPASDKGKSPGTPDIPDTEETHEVSGDSWVISMKYTRICNDKELIEHCKIDTAVWEVDRFKVARSEVGMKPAAYTTDETTADGRVIPMWRRDFDAKDPIVVPLFHITAWLKKRRWVEDTRQILADMVEDSKLWMPKPPGIIRPSSQSGNMLELGFHDAHFGKLAWAPETGWDNSDLKLSVDIWWEALETVLDRSSHLKYEKIVLLLGSDMLHIDNRRGETTAGTQMDVDTRYPRLYRKVRELFCQTTERCRGIAPVHIIPVPGNHDTNSTFTLSEAVHCWFHHYPDVFVDNDNPTLRKYIEWGRVMLMCTHGNDISLRKLLDIMPVEEPKMWGRTCIREIHTGDKHRRAADTQHLITEELGTVVRILPPLCATDSWHAGKGFIGNQRMAEGYMWNKEEGLVGTSSYTKLSDKFTGALAA